MVTKLKSRDNLKYLILVILICICSTVLLSRYGSFYEAGEKAQKEKADSMENVISDMGDGLAIGNCILDNENIRRARAVGAVGRIWNVSV